MTTNKNIPQVPSVYDVDLTDVSCKMYWNATQYATSYEIYRVDNGQTYRTSNLNYTVSGLQPKNKLSILKSDLKIVIGQVIGLIL